ncbi:MAG: hypothetical protein Ct9H90mP11_10510 [Acidimicrobiales bacterium]|nr:MAG: hypothetical protein Ct9H90mP11_10510 [Acidimicrobiales bacterium]
MLPYRYLTFDKAVGFYHEILGFEKVFSNSWFGDREQADQGFLV